MSYSEYWWKRELQAAQIPSLIQTARLARPALEEWTTAVDLAPGRAVLIPMGPPSPCSWCWQQRAIWHRSEATGELVPLPCDHCFGSGFEPA